MSNDRIFSVNGDVVRTFSHDSLTDKTTIASFQDVAPYLARNIEEQNSQSSMDRHGDGLQKIASIPLILIDQWRKEIGGDPLNVANRGWLMKRLQDPEYAYLRTRTGRYV